MEFKAKEIAEILGGTVDGNPEAVVTTFARIVAIFVHDYFFTIHSISISASNGNARTATHVLAG